MNAKTIGMIFAIFLLTIPVLACADGGSSGSGSSSGASSRVGGDDAVLKLLPDDTSLIFAMAAGEVTGGSVPESMTELFEQRWESFSLGGDDEILTVDDIDKIVWAGTPDGEIVMLSGSRINFEAISDWLADEDTNVGRTSYQGEEMWGGDTVAMVLLQSDGYLAIGDTDAVKELLKVKARGAGSLADDSENSLKQAYKDAAKGWYVSVANDCDEFFSNLRSCEAYSITGDRGKEDYLVNVTYRFVFRNEQRAESQSLDIEDEIEDWNLRWDIDEVEVDGVSVEARMSGDEEDFRPRWLSINIIPTPPPLPTAAPKSGSNTTTGTTTATTSGQTRVAPTVTSAPRAATAAARAAPTTVPAAPAATPAPQEGLRIAGPCTSDILRDGVYTGTWRDGCPLDVSDWSKGFAHYYRFRLDNTNLVVIELQPYAQAATVGLALLQGQVGNESVLAFHSDVGYARMQVQLAPGQYTIEVKATRQVADDPYYDLYVDIAQ